jgi:nudix-type nucleoside diphosphatase (YffH/AdpP family)
MRVNVLGEKIVYDGYISVIEASLQECCKSSNSTTYKRQKVLMPNSVCGLIYNTDTECVVLVKQFRYPIKSKINDGFIYEVVAGTMKENEDPRETFIRESFEEVGYVLDRKNVELYSCCYIAPGYSTEKMYYFIATATNKNKKKGAGGGLASENENIEICEIHYLQFKSMMDTLEDAKTKFLAYEAHFKKIFDKK